MKKIREPIPVRGRTAPRRPVARDGAVFELELALPPGGGTRRGLLRALHAQLKAAILDGRLGAGLALPPTRALARHLGISRNSVLAAYDLLLGEGYVRARPGAGTFVADLAPAPVRAPATRVPADAGDRRLAPPWRDLAAIHGPVPGRSFRYDFRLGLPDKSLFPLAVWRRLVARALRADARAPASYAEPEGQPALRQAIARHVSFTRAVAAGAEDVIVTSGTQQAFDLLARVLVTAGRTTVAVEDPCYPPLRAAFAAAGARLHAVPVDAEGLMVERLPRDTRVVCVTPSHQFPLGTVMSAVRRRALLAFARARDAVVIEDDYDSEFRFSGRPLDALQTLDPSGTVFYVGTFSKSIFPGLRLAFVVAPSWARAALARAKQIADWHSPVVLQDALASFIADGHMARHVRKTRRLYAERRRVLLDSLARRADGLVTPLPSDAGLHLAALLPARIPAARVVARAAGIGIGIEDLARYAASPRHAVNGLGFGFGGIATERVDEGVKRLVSAAGHAR
jgi:GntR family transcriptional regulator/MocR family aminotransferase